MDWIPFSLDRQQFEEFLLSAAPRVFAAVMVALIGWLVLRITQPAFRSALRRARFADGLITLLVDGMYRVVLALCTLLMAASQLGIDVSVMLAGFGVIGIAIGFAAQETVANTIAGFLIFWDRPFKIGDYITTQSRYGEVREITLRTTRIRTNDNTFVVIPNRQVIGDTLVNHSMYGATRVVVEIGIAYKEKIAEARAVLLAVLPGIEGVIAHPPPDVVARSLGDSSVNLEIRVWIDEAEDELPVEARVVEAAKVALDNAGISIPFPHLQLFVDQVEPRVWDGARALLTRDEN
ncbi:MAG: mechanosensitive ion channel family protein [Gemmatimonadales bacterium]|nr:mechanosensitive ion channel family protein [Gemmatimonadales bacterium]